MTSKRLRDVQREYHRSKEAEEQRRFQNDVQERSSVWLSVHGIDRRQMNQKSLNFCDNCTAKNTMSLDQKILWFFGILKQSLSPQSFQNRK